MYKYCVAQLNVNCKGEVRVSYYAFSNDMYGLHLVSDWNDANVIWYDTEEEAKKAIWNTNECIVDRYFESEDKKCTR